MERQEVMVSPRGPRLGQTFSPGTRNANCRFGRRSISVEAISLRLPAGLFLDTRSALPAGAGSERLPEFRHCSDSDLNLNTFCPSDRDLMDEI
jgi:hypothetical protein